MNNLTLTLTKKIKPYTYLTVDGEVVKPKFRRGVGTAKIQTEKSEVEIAYTRFSRFDSKLWWLLEIVYFLLSGFGLFDLRFGKHEYITNYKAKITLSEDTKVKIHIPNPKNGGPVLKLTTDANLIEEENAYSIDQEVKKKKKILLIAKIITAIIVVTTIAFIIFL